MKFTKNTNGKEREGWKQMEGAATDGAHNYGPGTHLYSWVERGTICVNTLPKDAILKYGQCRFRTHDPWIVSPTPYHCATEATKVRYAEYVVLKKIFFFKFHPLLVFRKLNSKS